MKAKLPKERFWKRESHARRVPSKQVARKESRGAFAGGWWYGGLLEGSVAVAMVAGTAALAGIPQDGPLLLLAFCGTLLVYYLDRTPTLSPEDRRHHPARWRWRQRHGRRAAALAVAAAIGACVALPYLQVETLVAGAGLAVPAVAYALPVFGGGAGAGRAKRLKDIGAAKPFAVAAAWAGASVLMPTLEAGSSCATNASLGAAALPLTLLAGYRFLFVLPNLLLADAADQEAADGSRLRRCAAGVLAATIVAGGLALGIRSEATLLLAVDLAGPALLLAFLIAEAPEKRSRHAARAADLAMLWPAVAAVLAGAGLA